MEKKNQERRNMFVMVGEKVNEENGGILKKMEIHPINKTQHVLLD